MAPRAATQVHVGASTEPADGGSGWLELLDDVGQAALRASPSPLLLPYYYATLTYNTRPRPRRRSSSTSATRISREQLNGWRSRQAMTPRTRQQSFFVARAAAQGQPLPSRAWRRERRRSRWKMSGLAAPLSLSSLLQSQTNNLPRPSAPRSRNSKKQKTNKQESQEEAKQKKRVSAGIEINLLLHGGGSSSSSSKGRGEWLEPAGASFRESLG